MAETSGSSMCDLSGLLSKEGDTLIHLLCRGTLRAKKQAFKKKLTKEEYSRLKDASDAVKADDFLSAITVLVECGCDVNIANEEGYTSLDILCDRAYCGVHAKIDKRKGSPVECDGLTLKLFQAIVNAGAKPSQNILKKIVKIAHVILFHNQSVTGPSWSPSQEELRKTPITVFHMSGKLLLTDVCLLIIDKVCHPRIDPALMLKILCVYLGITYTNVLRGGVLVHLLRSIGMRFDEDQDFAHALLFCERDSYNRASQKRDTDMLYALDQVISALAGEKGCDAIRHRCPKIGTTPLHLAVVLGLKDMVTYFLQHPLVKINILDDEGNSPLMAVLNIMRHRRVWASPRLGLYLEIAIALAEENTQNFNLEDKMGSTPLLYCIEAIRALGSQYRDHRLYKQIYRDSSNHRTPLVIYGQTAVMLCVIENLIESLTSILSHHPLPDMLAADPRGMTALHLCGGHARKECAELLIEACPDLCGVPDSRGNTPLFYLMEKLPAEEALQLLTKHASLWEINKKNSVNQSALDYYKEQLPRSKRDRDLEKAMAHFCDAAQFRDSFPEPRMAAETFGKMPKRDSLKKSFSKIFRHDQARAGERREDRSSVYSPFSSSDDSLTSYTSAMEHEFVHKTLRGHLEDINAMQKLFERVAAKTTKVNTQNVNKKSATMLCAENGLVDELDYIIRTLNPDLNATDGQGMTALHLAANKKQTDCVHVLLKAPNMDINTQDKLGNSAIFYIVVKFTPNEAAKILGSGNLNWDLNIRNSYDHTAYEYYMEKLTQRHLNEDLANVLARRCIPPLPRRVPDRSSTGTGTLTPRFPRDRLSPNDRISPNVGTYGNAYGNGAAAFQFGSETDLANHKWRAVFKKYRIFFMEHFESHPLFYSYLIQTGVMDEYTANKIQNKAAPELDKAGDIFDNIRKKDERGFKHFIDALRKSSLDIIANELKTALEEDNFENTFTNAH